MSMNCGVFSARSLRRPPLQGHAGRSVFWWNDVRKPPPPALR